MADFICNKCETIFDKAKESQCPKCGESLGITMLRLWRMIHPESGEKGTQYCFEGFDRWMSASFTVKGGVYVGAG